MIEIIEPGPLTTVQDRGRPGYRALGVARSGAFDRRAAGLANRLVGNAPDDALLEITLGGLAWRTGDAVTVALTGAACAGISWGTAVTLPAGATVRLGTPRSGLRSYLAVRGGILADRVLGSRSTDLLGGLGPAPLRAGQVLGIGQAPRDGVSELAATPGGARRPLRVLPGPRWDWFEAGALDRLLTTTWTVRPDSDRIGIRLDGPPLVRLREGDLPSEPTRPGAIQVPADGRPIIFGPDAPVTGGYPVIGMLADLDPAAQLRPGDPVVFGSADGLRNP